MSQNISTKGKRAPNFTVKEKSLLLNIIHDYKNVIENKQTNATTWREKDMAWTEIAASFNSHNKDYVRTKENLKKYYENIKKTIRKEVAEEKKEIIKTGGGTFIVNNDPIKDLALDLMNEKTVYGFQNSFDGDVAPGLNDAVVIMEEEHETSIPGYHDHNYTQEENENLESELAKNTISHEPGPGFSGHVSFPKTPSLQNTWTKRCRPQVKLTELEIANIEAARAKKLCFDEELINIRARRQQEKEIFELQKEKLALEIKNLKP